ncbi:MAG TPA: hypothetical protein VFN44_01230, partial [Solirubrobacteraceae bacterium]|nr:hypothetical protein [Solirubrobacteraceae bacterium]
MTATRVAPPATESANPEILVLADGVELLGEYEDSGFREPPLLARRGDGQMIKLTPLLHAVAGACDGRRDAEQVAAVVSEREGRGVSGENVRQLAEAQLRPLGVLARADGTTPELPKRKALLSLRHRRPILRAPAVNVIAAAFSWLHARPVKFALLAMLLAFDAWLFGVHGIAGGIRTVLYEPAWLLALLVSIVVATAFHEIGHASACRFSGARPGEMGVGVYLVWPAFYCDVTEAYRLDRRGRLRTDLGGVYFNGLFALACGATYLATGAEALLFAAFVQHLIVLQQLMPLLRFDGYYVLSDLTGVPDILSRIKPIFRSLVRGRRREPRVAELKPWVRLAVTAYLIVLIPLLALIIGSIVMSAPRTFATAYDSFWLQLDRMRASHGFAEMGVGAFRIAALVMPLAAMSLSLSRTLRMG